jgi:hypothetical protein
MRELISGVAAVLAFYVYILPGVTLLNRCKVRQALGNPSRVMLGPLFADVDLSQVKIVANAIMPWPRPRRAITLGSSVYIRDGFDQAKSRDLRLLLHELVHVDQYRRLGMLGFIWAYGRALGRSGSYRKNSLEVEAFIFATQHRGVVGHL